MEALLLIFAEIIFACLAPLLSAIGAFFGLIVEAIALAFGSSGFKSSKTKPRKAPKLPRKVLHWSAGLLGGFAVLGVLASIVFFDPLLRTVLNRAGDKAGIAISYQDSSGSLLFGHVELSNLVMTRESATGLAFDLTVEEVAADVDIWSLLGEPRLQFAEVSGLSGTITPPDPKEEAETTDRPKKVRRPFRADRVTVEDVALEIAPRGQAPYGLEIVAGEVAPLRSQLALFDLLFRSNLEARIAGQPLRVETREISSNGRETFWEFDQVEADRMKLILPKAPLTWLNGGTVTVRVDDRWDLDEEVIDMDWRIAMAGIDVAAPGSAGTAERLLAGGLDRAVAAQGGDAEFLYRLELDPEQVAELREGDLNAFWDAVLSGFKTRRPTEVTGEPEEPGRIRRSFDALKERLRRDDAGE